MRVIGKMLLILFKILIAVIAVVLIVNFVVVFSDSSHINSTVSSTDITFSKDQLEGMKTEKAQCILVLGAAVKPDGSPSAILRDRLDVAIALYKRGIAPKLLLSGDNGSVDYNEVKCMRNYAVGAGVASEDIFLDHAGFSTYESIYRARDVFGVSSMIVVTQKYHMYRALYIADKLGVSAVGVCSNQQSYSEQVIWSTREILARDKDFVQCIYKPEPTYLGSSIDISGSGLSTQD
jgi:vancomycin permeability regulator SanA